MEPTNGKESKSRTAKTTEYLRYQFTLDEQRENAKELARRNQALAELEARKKRLTADLKAEQETAEAEVQKLSRWVNDEHSYRMIDCEWHFHEPKTGMKQLIRLDTGEVAKEVFMSGAEMQEVLPLEENFAQVQGSEPVPFA